MKKPRCLHHSLSNAMGVTKGCKKIYLHFWMIHTTPYRKFHNFFFSFEPFPYITLPLWSVLECLQFEFLLVVIYIMQVWRSKLLSPRIWVFRPSWCPGADNCLRRSHRPILIPSE